MAATATLAGCDVPVGGAYPGPVVYPVVPIYGVRRHDEGYPERHDEGPSPGRYAQPMGPAGDRGYYPPQMPPPAPPVRQYQDRYAPPPHDRPRDERHQRQDRREQDNRKRQDQRQQDRHRRKDERKRKDQPSQQPDSPPQDGSGQRAYPLLPTTRP
ncbi:hypothetical protein BJI67_11945 [Acidihalobacter aeolianus]|uniref:Uncharacterized protein n=1 Tax=Acidihalobacter aeolianus TaxID=2792603 RepID=A0A1D8K9Q6_9GAMM|nr:hypothetical protein BJI67_11945 [Acidihalobacter aeolianus]